MTLLITGHDLDAAAVVSVARAGERVALDPSAVAAMRRARRVAERAMERGDAIYGLTTAVGVLKRVPLGAGDDDFHQRLLAHHAVGQGDPAPADVVRATMLVLANLLAGATSMARPELAERLVLALNAGETPHMRIRGSIGQADLAALGDLGLDLFGEIRLEAGEGLSLIDNNAYSTAVAALALWDVRRLLDAMEVAGALSLEGLAGNVSTLHVAVAESRPYPGLRASRERLARLLEGSYLWQAGAARALQDPLTFRNLAQLQGAARDAVAHGLAQLAIELNASQGNPLVVSAEDRIVSVANFEVLPLAAALDYVRIVLASALSAACERVVKLLDRPWSGLPTGLAPGGRAGDPGLAYIAIATQAVTAEARLLAQPVSFEVVSTTHAEGIEDRMTMAPLAAWRLIEMVRLGARVVAAELIVAAQATELRDAGPLGVGSGSAFAAVRGQVAFHPGGPVQPPDVDTLAERILDDSLGLPS